MAEHEAQTSPDDAAMDLLIKQATEGLSPAEERELEALDGATLSEYSRDIERATAAVSLAANPHPQPMPASLQARLQRLGAQHAAATANANARAEADGAAVLPHRAVARVKRSSAGYAWFVAAACFVLAIFGWLRTPPPPASSAAVLSQNTSSTASPTPSAPVTTPASAASAVPAPLASRKAGDAQRLAKVTAENPRALAAERSALLATDGTTKITLGATKDPGAAGVSGDAVWDPVSQTGYLHFSGLKPNDPSRQVYQVWVFDATRDKRYPVDGGIFDIPKDATEAIIPIHAAISVRQLAAIAVTVEKPGGVVVSAREHVVALGAAT